MVKSFLGGGGLESSELGSTNICAFCLSTITEYSKSCLWVLTLTKALPQRVDMACGHLEVLYGDLWGYLCQLCLSMHFCDGNGWVWTIGIVKRRHC